MNLKRNFIVLCLLAVFISVVYCEISENTTENIEEIKEKEEEVTDNEENYENAVEYVDKSEEIEEVEETETESSVTENEKKIENVESEKVEETVKIEPRARAFVAPVESVVATDVQPSKNKDAKTGRYMDYSGSLDTYNTDTSNYDWNGKKLIFSIFYLINLCF